MRKPTIFHLLAVALIGAFLMGCGPTDPGEGGGDENTAPDATSQGWTAFRAGDYETAASSFILALTLDASNADAHNGLGWSLTNLGNLQNALTSFDTAIDNGLASADALAGKTIILRDRRPVDHSATIDAATATLVKDQDWVFEHDTRLDWRDVRLVLAQSYFAIGEYDIVNDQIELLGGTRQDPASPNYVLGLLTELQALGSIFSGTEN